MAAQPIATPVRELQMPVCHSLQSLPARWRVAIAVVFAAVAASLALAAPARADYPERTVRLILGLQPGASTDVLARLVANKLSERMGQQFIVENKPGAATRIGMESVAKSPPDGYTLGVANAVSTAFPLMFDDFPFAPGKDFTPVTPLGRAPSFLAVRHNLPVKNAAEFVAYAKANNGKLSFAIGIHGSPPHMALLLLMKSIGVSAVGVPYKGNGPAALALATGEVDFALLEYASVRPMLERGTVRLLAVTEPRRFSAQPDVPTGVEAGLTPEIEGMTSWFMLVAPARTPSSVVSLLNEHVRAILQLKDVQQSLVPLGIQAESSSPAEAAAYFQAKRDKLAALVRELNLSLKN
jgi:tripartite-type tricarboxylate transporter receptor subunit TctC